jgi:hypothetical protein
VPQVTDLDVARRAIIKLMPRTGITTTQLKIDFLVELAYQFN